MDENKIFECISQGVQKDDIHRKWSFYREPGELNSIIFWISENHQYYRLWDHSKDNQNIKNLLNDFGISSTITESVSKILKESFNNLIIF